MEKASKLTKEQIDYLLHNENVAGVTEKNIFFTVEFKEKFYALYESGMKHYAIFKQLGVDPEMIGYRLERGSYMEELIKINKNDISKNKKIEIVDLTVSLMDSGLDLSNYEKIPISTIGELGAIGAPIVEALETISGAGGSGLYMVNTAGGTLFQCASKGAYIGAMTKPTGEIGQAALTQVLFNPVSLCSTVTMVTTMMKLDEISQNVKDILSLIDLKDRAVIKRAMLRLTETMNQYKENANDAEQLKLDLQEIRIKQMNDMIDIQLEYKDRIEELIKENKSSKTHYRKIRKAFYYY